MREETLTINKNYDVCIVGAGVAGATLAARLGKAGKKVAIVERNLNERDVIVGELLQPGGVKYLQEMELDFFLHDLDAQAVKGYNIIFQNKETQIQYPHKKGDPLGFGFRNGKFVQNMRNYILRLDNVDVFEGRVSSILENEELVCGIEYFPKKNEKPFQINAALTIISDGPLSKFRESFSKPEIKVSGFFVGIILENCPLPYPSYGHLVIGPHPPFVMYPVNSNEIRILIDFPGTQPPKINDAFKDELLNTFLPEMPDSMKKSFSKAVEKGGFKMMPNHRMPAQPVFKKGAVLLGDSLNMRHPLTGGGMTAAFADVSNLSSKLLTIGDFTNSQKIEKAVKSFYENRHLGNQTINILADGLYGVVNHPDLREAFFEYVNRGGKFATEPIAILSGLNKDKKLLRKHFFAVANYGTKLKIRNEVGTRKLESSYSMMKEAVKIITPLLMSEKPEPATKLLLEILAKAQPSETD
jgi:squalene monooxygenase